MARDTTLAVRRAVLATLKFDAGLTALVPSSSIHPSTVPADHSWPFVRYGAPSASPRRASCMDGTAHAIVVHGFAKPRYSGQAMIETAEDHAMRIGAAIAAALDRRKLTLAGDYPGAAHISWSGTQMLQDPAEADSWHAVVQFTVRVVS